MDEKWTMSYFIIIVALVFDKLWAYFGPPISPPLKSNDKKKKKDFKHIEKVKNLWSFKRISPLEKVLPFGEVISTNKKDILLCRKTLLLFKQFSTFGKNFFSFF